MKCLIIGCGSIGRRHVTNLLKLKQEVYCYDRDFPKMQLLVNDLSISPYEFKSHHEKMDAFVICTPPEYHVPFAMEAIEHDSHIFIEKPLSNFLTDVGKLIETAHAKNLKIQVGYQLRFDNRLQWVKKQLESGRIGKLLSMQFEFGRYLPDWHPTEDYMKGYTASTGVTLDASHEIDLAQWFYPYQSVPSIFSQSAKLSDLQITSEDTANILLNWGDVLCSIHLDMINRQYTRTCRLIGSDATIFWDYTSPMVTIMGKERQYVHFEPNDPYLDEMKSFIECIERDLTPLVTVWQAKAVLEIALKAKGVV